MTVTFNEEDDYCYGNDISLSPVLLLSMAKAPWQGHPCLTGFWPLGWCWGLGLTTSPRKNSVVTKLREQGGHGSETGRRAVEDESCYDALKSATTSASQFLSSSQQMALP
jgi:hypothetical protein